MDLFFDPKENSFFFFFFTFILFLRETDRQSASGVGEDTESKAGSRLPADGTEPDVGLQLSNCEIMTCAKGGRLTDWATQAPRFVFSL